MLEQNTNYDEMGQGIDRITEILNRQSQPIPASPYASQALPLPANVLNAIASSSYDYGSGGSDFVGNAQKYVTNEQDRELNNAKSILQAYEMKLRMGDAKAKALDDKINLFTGDDPQGKAMFLQALHDDPEPIDPTNSYQVMTKLAAIKKQTGYESPELKLKRAMDNADLNLKNAQISKIGLDNDKSRAELKAIESGKLPPTEQFKNENILRDEFNNISKDFRTVQDAYSKIKSTSDSGAGDMSMLYAYVKLLDPTSVVRESEFATAAATGSYGEQIQGQVKSILAGGRLAPSVRANFLNEADRIYQGQKLGYDRIKSVYTDIAGRNGLNSQNIITNYAEPEKAGVTPPTGSHPLDKYNRP